MGAGWSIKRGFGTHEDLSFVKENGQMKGIMPDNVSELAKNTNPMKWVLLGSGNH
ncbi:RtcB family protein [Coxiella endosymbiont of Ornithodoros amblus]|uniref:RtcB family protein n=1 Tax=Coxiella endosymbiont of Ornithodoros amblus TaxID=1656166 RepID=UPI00244E16B6|nr:RtcB family protein [Coxiella endosymbiont of Ornithodoros amblus]